MPQRQCLRAISRRDEVRLRFSYRDASAASQKAHRRVWAVGRLGLTVGEADHMKRVLADIDADHGDR
jgi:hypothetical protein